MANAPIDFHTAIAAAIDAERKKLKLTQQEAADLMGIPYTTLSGLMNKKDYGRLTYEQAESALLAVVPDTQRDGYRAMPGFPKQELSIEQVLTSLLPPTPAGSPPPEQHSFGSLLHAIRTELQGMTPGLKLGHKELAIPGTGAASISMIENERTPVGGVKETVGRALIEKLGALSGRNYTGNAGVVNFLMDAIAAKELQSARSDYFAPTMEAIIRDKGFWNSTTNGPNLTDFSADFEKKTGVELPKNFVYNCRRGAKTPTATEVGWFVDYAGASDERGLYAQEAPRREHYGLSAVSQRPLPAFVLNARALRTELGIEQEVLSRAAKLSPGFVGHMEKDRETAISPREEEAIAKALGCADADQLMEMGGAARHLQQQRNAHFGDALTAVIPNTSSNRIAEDLGFSKGMIDTNVSSGHVVPDAARKICTALHKKGLIDSPTETALYDAVGLESIDLQMAQAVQDFVAGFDYNALATAASTSPTGNTRVGKRNARSRR